METLTPGTGSTRDDTSISQASIDGSNSVNDELNSVLNENKFAVEEVDARIGSFGNEENYAPIALSFLHSISSNIYQIQEKEIVDEVTVRTSEVEYLEQELELMKAAPEMAFDNQQSIEFYLDKLTKQVEAKRDYLSTLESEWDAIRRPLEQRKRTLEESLYSKIPDTQVMLQKLREVQQEEEFISSEIRKRSFQF
ncbi:uncharacterized protein LOC131636041 [Vicia villosa]|uniref:uncharacterized protein LOC131636041 n=1 Tax=Vicia villosa TaxID=3911 RepID=UPI00273A856D|nr:uncharacterized protein LOC131636041 [Vicia villosa]